MEEHWTIAVITEASRVIRHALASWAKTGRLCVLTMVVAAALSAVLVVAHR